jgi:hypothetical protein
MLQYYAGVLIIISVIFGTVYNVSTKNHKIIKPKKIIKELYTECSEPWGQFVALDE